MSNENQSKDQNSGKNFLSAILNAVGEAAKNGGAVVLDVAGFGLVGGQVAWLEKKKSLIEKALCGVKQEIEENAAEQAEIEGLIKHALDDEALAKDGISYKLKLEADAEKLLADKAVMEEELSELLVKIEETKEAEEKAKQEAESAKEKFKKTASDLGDQFDKAGDEAGKTLDRTVDEIDGTLNKALDSIAGIFNGKKDSDVVERLKKHKSKREVEERFAAYKASALEDEVLKDAEDWENGDLGRSEKHAVASQVTVEQLQQAAGVGAKDETGGSQPPAGEAADNHQQPQAGEEPKGESGNPSEKQ